MWKGRFLNKSAKKLNVLTSRAKYLYAFCTSLKPPIIMVDKHANTVAINKLLGRKMTTSLTPKLNTHYEQL